MRQACSAQARAGRATVTQGAHWVPKEMQQVYNLVPAHLMAAPSSFHLMGDATLFLACISFAPTWAEERTNLVDEYDRTHSRCARRPCRASNVSDPHPGPTLDVLRQPTSRRAGMSTVGVSANPIAETQCNSMVGTDADHHNR